MAVKLSFEKAMEQLEQIVQELESEELPLEKAIKKFEEGIKLSKFCNQKLEESEKKVTVLMEGQDGQPKEVDRDDPDD
ncbi:MAG: exodeoxyribonuclease VII small subunit [Desulfobacteraceae bacterium]|jgi:exodeoxyribonuclease VII small subunit